MTGRLPEAPGSGARVRVELFEPVRRGSARPLAHPGSPGPAGSTVSDVPPNVGAHVVGTEPAGSGAHLPPPPGGAVVARAQALAPVVAALPGGSRERRAAA
ncbi:hypothetical protein IOD16_28780 [Saccharothrix sp. 6-C]|uniref:hypothetical protein n=1 Tax=Saccharothrix sp. 6-C TaxID=2781735 RepID=UPI0019176853|nr:hypothetical protein [Saccharothrix sp. 6-C]QQQ75078.1 hypothetical protein IOD16_28780 [Saccharothrix sp. 6-C]